MNTRQNLQSSGRGEKIAPTGLLLFIRNKLDPLEPSTDPANDPACTLLLARVAEAMDWPVAACRIAIGYPAAVEVVETFNAQGCQNLVVLVLTLGEQDYEVDDLLSLLEWQATQQPRMKIHWGGAIGTHSGIVATLAAHATSAQDATSSTIPPNKTALALVGRGSSDPQHNAELVRVARLLWEGRAYGWVEAGFYNRTQPNVTTTLLRCLQLGAQEIVVLPYLLFDPATTHSIAVQARRFQSAYPSASILLAEPLDEEIAVVTAIAERCRMVLQRPAASASHSHGQGMDSLLPPRYRGNSQVSAAPMGAAPLIFDAEGQVAWDHVWGGDDPTNPFCELALAGGPPHRGELLEPVLPSDVMNSYGEYGRVVAELTRGIHITTGLPTQLSPIPGWVGVRCDSEEMAIWLLRAIIVENIIVRREGMVLYLPAGPKFRLEYEIKNVITALAKTHHYWIEHCLG